MNDYISSPDYQSDGKHQGICFGIEQHVDENTADNNYTVSLHFPDMKIGLSQKGYSQGIPNLKNPVWLPYTSAPDLLSFTRYQHNGLAFMQSVMGY